MKASNYIAFKEWAAICEALGAGRQVIIARKGGIHEGRAGFQVEHREFWLFPTYVHQQEEGLADEARPLLERALAERPPEGTLRIGLYVVVEEVIELTDERLIPLVAGQHVWSHRTLVERFHYRQPGLYLLAARVYRAERPFELVDSPHFAGCRSWVELPSDLATEGLTPVLSEDEFARRLAELRSAARPTRLA